MKRFLFVAISLVLMLILAVGCKAQAPESTVDADTYAIFTAISLTAEQTGQQISATTPAPPQPTSPGSTVTPTPDSEPTSAESTSEVSPSGEGDLTQFVDDVTIKDETELPPNQRFTKTWLLQNIGTTTWTPEYSLVFISGDRMEAPASVPLTRNVAPSDTIEVSVDLVAPALPMQYRGYFSMQNAAGESFGAGFWVEIVVSEDATPLDTPTPSVSPEVITNIFLSVNAAAANNCPNTFKFTGLITVSEPAPVIYKVEGGGSDPSITNNLPPQVNTTLNAGTNRYEFNLTLNKSLNGWVTLHILFPGDQYSNRVNFTLNCPE
jgi:hypothetical protein